MEHVKGLMEGQKTVSGVFIDEVSFAEVGDGERKK